MHGISYEYVSLLLQTLFPTVARSAERGREAVRQLESEGLHPELLSLDVTSVESVTAARQKVQQSHNRLDVLVNNAGVMFRVRAMYR